MVLVPLVLRDQWVRREQLERVVIRELPEKEEHRVPQDHRVLKVTLVLEVQQEKLEK